MNSIHDIYYEVITKFKLHQIDSPEANAGWLLAYGLNCNHQKVFTYPELPVTPAQYERVLSLASRHIEGEPIQYITGETEFYNSTIHVGPGVLIPRPETECLVGIAIDLCKNRSGRILDLCTGSGCILLALCKELNRIQQFIGIDIDAAAIYWALKNKNLICRENLNAKISFIQGNLFDPLRHHSEFTLITANPPYISRSEFDKLPKVIKNHEPQKALFGGIDGLTIFRKIAIQACDYLVKDGWLVCEIGENQGNAAVNILGQYGYSKIKIIKDYTGRDRIIIGQNIK